MKTITIPTNCNPYIVVINNHAYTYRAGDTVDVPDEVAEAIEDAIELVPKPKRYLSNFAKRVEGSITELTESDLNGVEAIAFYALAYSRQLKSIDIPSGVKSIGDGAFYGCNKLEIVRFEANSKIESIGTVAFNFCNLSSVFLPECPPALANIDAFANTKAECVFYCKNQASLDAYKAAPIWSTLTGTYSFVVEE